MKLSKKRNAANSNPIAITLIICTSILVLAIISSLIYINQQNIVANERERAKQREQDMTKEAEQTRVENAKLKQAKLDACLSSIDPSQDSSLQSVARSSCFYAFNN